VCWQRKAADFLESELELPEVCCSSVPVFSSTFAFLQLKATILEHCKGILFLILNWEYSPNGITAMLSIIWGDRWLGERPLPSACFVADLDGKQSRKCYNRINTVNRFLNSKMFPAGVN